MYTDKQKSHHWGNAFNWKLGMWIQIEPRRWTTQKQNKRTLYGIVFAFSRHSNNNDNKDGKIN